MMRGQSILISHAILVGLTVFLVYAVSTTFVSIRDDYQEFVGGNEVRQVCFVLKNAAEKVYFESDYNSDSTLSSVDVRLPPTVADLRYRAKFENRSVVIESLENKFNETCKIGLDVVYAGSTAGGITRISFGISNGTRTINMVKV